MPTSKEVTEAEQVAPQCRVVARTGEQGDTRLGLGLREGRSWTPSVQSSGTTSGWGYNLWWLPLGVEVEGAVRVWLCTHAASRLFRETLRHWLPEPESGTGSHLGAVLCH